MENEEEKTIGIFNSFEKFCCRDKQKNKEVMNGRCEIEEFFFHMEYSRILLIRVIVITKAIKRKRGGEQRKERKLCRNRRQ